MESDVEGNRVAYLHNKLEQLGYTLVNSNYI